MYGNMTSIGMGGAFVPSSLSLTPLSVQSFNSSSVFQQSALEFIPGDSKGADGSINLFSRANFIPFSSDNW